MSRTLDAGWSSARLVRDGVSMSYVQTGSTGKPLAVLLHGFGDNGLAWTRVARTLQSRFDVVMPDCRGHGLTQTTAPSYAMADACEDVAELITSLREGPAALVIGHSMGGLVATELAARHPDLVTLLVLEDPPLRWVQRLGARPALTVGLWLMKIWVRPLSVARIDRIAARMYSRWTPEDVAAWAQAQHESAPQSAAAASKALGRNRDWPGLLRGVHAPTLLITAQRGVIKEDEGRELIALLEDGEEVRIEGAGHNVHRDKYDDFMCAVANFIDS